MGWLDSLFGSNSNSQTNDSGSTSGSTSTVGGQHTDASRVTDSTGTNNTTETNLLLGHTVGTSTGATTGTSTNNQTGTSRTNSRTGTNNTTTSTGNKSGVSSDSGFTTTNSGSVNTTRLDINQAGVDAMINRALGANDGLASVTSGEKVAGFYDSSTKTLLANDLLSRVVGEVAAKTGTTTQNIGGNTSTVGARTISTSENSTDVSSMIGSQDTVADTATGSTGTSTNASTTTGSTDTGTIQGTTGHRDQTSTNSTNEQDVADVVSGSQTEGSTNTVSQQAVDNSHKGLLSWVICTELHRQGKMPSRWYVHGARVFAKYPSVIHDGYHWYAVPIVRVMRKSPMLTELMRIPFNWRAENIAAHAGVPGARKLIRGAMVTAILYPLSFIIGLCVRTQDWKSLYRENK